MSNLPEVVAVYGGLNTSEEALMKFGGAVIDYGFAAENAVVRPFTVGKAGRDPEEAAAAAEGGLAVMHSMGTLVTKPMARMGVRPAGMIVANRPMPSSGRRLVAGGGERLEHHLVRSVAGPHVEGHRQIVADTGQMFEDWSGNIGRIPEVISFSGDKWMEAVAAPSSEDADDAIPAAAIISCNDDVGGADYEVPGTAAGVAYGFDLRGCHDRALYDVNGFLGLVASLNVLPRR